MSNAKLSIECRLMKYRRIDLETGCWLWTGRIADNGYGQTSIDTKPYSVHRVSASIYLGLDLNSNFQSNHKLECKNKHCFNPEHLYVGTASQNSNDIVRAGRNFNRNKTHCKNGHEYTKE